MKKLIFLIIFLISTNAYADAIPGWLELDISAQKWSPINNTDVYYNTEIDFKYGATFGFFKPYIKANNKTFFQTTDTFYKNHPFRDVYNIGFGFIIKNTFYVEALHTCSHFVESHSDQKELYKLFRRYKDNHFKIGLKFNID